MMMARALFNDSTVVAPIALSLWKYLTGKPITFEDLSDVNPSAFTGFHQLLESKIDPDEDLYRFEYRGMPPPPPFLFILPPFIHPRLS